MIENPSPTSTPSACHRKTMKWLDRLCWSRQLEQFVSTCLVQCWWPAPLRFSRLLVARRGPILDLTRKSITSECVLVSEKTRSGFSRRVTFLSSCSPRPSWASTETEKEQSFGSGEEEALTQDFGPTRLQTTARVSYLIITDVSVSVSRWLTAVGVLTDDHIFADGGCRKHLLWCQSFVLRSSKFFLLFCLWNKNKQKKNLT